MISENDYITGSYIVDYLDCDGQLLPGCQLKNISSLEMAKQSAEANLAFYGAKQYRILRILSQSKDSIESLARRSTDGLLR